MSTVDLVLVPLLAVSAYGGYRIGLIVRAAGLVGFVGGLGLSAVTVPWAVSLVAPVTAFSRLLTSLSSVLVTITIVSLLADLVAVRIRRAIADTPLRKIDKIGGLAAGAASVLAFVWFAAPLAGMVPGKVAQEVRGSVIVSAVQALTPTPPNPLAALQNLLSDSRFPEVFADLAPAPAVQPPPEAIPVSQETVDRVARSTVKVEAAGCGAAFAGSGWTVSEGLIVTNAHVVAGADAVQVLRPDGTRLDGTVVVFDDDRDLALVEVPDLGQQPLQLGTADDGEGAATFGHPAGQDQLRIAPARVESTITAVGRDIYGQDRTERQVVILGAQLQQGDSGSAAVDADGTVVGTVFAVSPDSPGTAYALSNDELRAVLDAPRSPGDTGRCS